jgi:hypothetical protein
MESNDFSKVLKKHFLQTRDIINNLRDENRINKNKIEELYDIISELEEKNRVLGFENKEYSREIVKEHLHFLLPDKYKLFWDIIMHLFGDRVFTPIYLLKNSLSSIFVIICVIYYMHNYFGMTLYCTIA